MASVVVVVARCKHCCSKTSNRSDGNNDDSRSYAKHRAALNETNNCDVNRYACNHKINSNGNSNRLCDSTWSGRRTRKSNKNVAAAVSAAIVNI